MAPTCRPSEWTRLRTTPAPDALAERWRAMLWRDGGPPESVPGPETSAGSRSTPGRRRVLRVSTLPRGARPRSSRSTATPSRVWLRRADGGGVRAPASFRRFAASHPVRYHRSGPARGTHCSGLAARGGTGSPVIAIAIGPTCRPAPTRILGELIEASGMAGGVADPRDAALLADDCLAGARGIRLPPCRVVGDGQREDSVGLPGCIPTAPRSSSTVPMPPVRDSVLRALTGRGFRRLVTAASAVPRRRRALDPPRGREAHRQGRGRDDSSFSWPNANPVLKPAQGTGGSVCGRETAPQLGTAA